MQTLASILAGSGTNPYQMTQGISPMLQQYMQYMQQAGQQPATGALPQYLDMQQNSQQQQIGAMPQGGQPSYAQPSRAQPGLGSMGMAAQPMY